MHNDMDSEMGQDVQKELVGIVTTEGQNSGAILETRSLLQFATCKTDELLARQEMTIVRKGSQYTLKHKGKSD
jgi:hypothetical protein